MQSNAIELKNVGLTIAGQQILSAIDWSVSVGARAVVLGPNGCGKSTLLRTICGYLFPTTGTVRILDRQIGKVNLDDLRKRIGIVDPSENGCFGLDGRLTAVQAVASGFFGHLCLDFDVPSVEQLDRAEELVRHVGLGDKRNRQFGVMSTGERRRVLLARALVHRPDLLVLDEPTAGLDLPARESLLATLGRITQARPELTILLVTHHLDEMPADVDNILLLASGKVTACGTPGNVLQSDNVSNAFGCAVEVCDVHGRWHWFVKPDAWQALQ